MDVSGKVAVLTKQKSNLYCLPCHRDSLEEPAHGYCQDCQEHLCQSCFQHHKRPKPSRNHILLDKDAMPMQQTIDDLNPDDITEVCATHKDKVLDFYCNTHKSVACYVCVALEHKQCEVDYIPDVSGNISDELKSLIKMMKILFKKCKSYIKIAKTNIEKLEKGHEKVVREIKSFREEINAYLTQMESRMIEDAKSLADKAKSQLDNSKRACVQIAKEVRCSLSVFNELAEENKKNRLFIEMKNAEPRVVTLTDNVRQTVEDNKADDCIEFVRNQKLLYQLMSEKTFGMVSTYRKLPTLCVNYEKTIKLKSASDNVSCDIYGMALVSTTHVIVADYYNRKIKMFDIDNETLVSEITLSSEPRDVIKLPQNKLAVASPCGNFIQKLSFTDTRLTLDNRINIGEECYCVAYCQGKLVVGCNCDPGKLVILDLDGNVIKVFDTPGLLSGPEKITVSNDEEFLYVSDYYREVSRCIKMDWQGNAVQTFEQPGFTRPVGIQELEDGTLLVCSNRKIVRLSSSFDKYEILALENASLNYPKVICKIKQMLFINCSSEPKNLGTDQLKIFNVKWI